MKHLHDPAESATSTGSQSGTAAIPLPAELPAIPHASTNEKLIVGKLVTDLLAAGATITVNDGEEDVLVDCTNAALIWPALSSTDMDYLFVRRPNDTRHRSVTLVWGNDVDVISDYSTALETLVAPANSLANKLERR